VLRPLSSRAGAALAAHVRGSSDRHLERTLASRPALRILFAALARRFDPVGAAGFTGALRFELSLTGGRERAWILVITPERAMARGGRHEQPAAVVVRAGAADFVRLAAGVLHPARALLSGRLDVAGDLGVARRLGPMFGVGSIL
jgi:putative sterol carrier protein